jgi:flagellar biosynthetic protein FliQ
MTPEFLVDLALRTLRTALLLATPPLVAGLVVGVVVSIFQAVTQIQEQTLVQVPKMFAVVAVMMVLLPWMLRLLIDFTVHLLVHIPDYVR